VPQADIISPDNIAAADNSEKEVIGVLDSWQKKSEVIIIYLKGNSIWILQKSPGIKIFTRRVKS